MAHIYIYSPSGAVRDKAAFKRGVSRLKQQGHEVEIDPDALESHTRFAGDDATRLAAIHRAAASGADVALITRGGYGLSRLLPQIDYKSVAKAIRKGTHFVGVSDFTAFQAAVLAKTGESTWAGPALGEDLGAELPDEIMQACWDDLVSGQGEGTGWRLSAQCRLAQPQPDGVWVKNAVLWGGNLAVLTSLLGTPFFPNISRGILFLEDVGEHPYRIERMLSQLLHAGVLDKQKAVLLGHFSQYKLTPHDRGYKLSHVVDWLRTVTQTPVLTDLPFGHVPTKVCLPVGQSVRLVVEGREALVLWAHTHHL